MAKREVVTLNEDISKLQVPQSGDSYILPRDVEISGVLSGINGINSNGLDITLSGGNGQDSGATDRDGGNLILRAGASANSGTPGMIQFGNASDSSIKLQLGDDYIFENPLLVDVGNMGVYSVFGGFKVNFEGTLESFFGPYCQAGLTAQGFMVHYPEFLYHQATSMGSVDLKVVSNGESVQMLQNNGTGLFLFRGLDWSTSTEYPGFSLGSVQGPKDQFHIGNATIESTFNLYLGQLDHTAGGYVPQTITISPTYGGMWEPDQGNTTGSDMIIKGGDAFDSGATGRNGGNLILKGGNKANSGIDGIIDIQSDISFNGNTNLFAENVSTLSIANGTTRQYLKVYDKYDGSLPNDTYVTIAGDGKITANSSINTPTLTLGGGSSPSNGSHTILKGGSSFGGNGGNVTIQGGSGFSGQGGNVSIISGTDPIGTPGNITLTSTGLITVSGDFVADGTILNPQSAVTSPSEGEVRVWAKTTEPNALILTDSAGNDTVLSDPSLLGSITEYVTYTVGAGQDFETLMDAISWLQEETFSGGGHVEFQLTADTHVIAPITGEEGRYDWYYAIGAFTNAVVTFKGVNSASTTIAYDSTDPDTDGFDLFSFVNSYVFFSGLTIDTYGDGFTSYEKYVHLDSSFVYYRNCVIKNTRVYASNTTITILSSVFDSATLSMASFSKLITYSNSFFLRFENWNGGGAALSVVDGSTVISDAHAISFTNNGTDTNIPLNVIQSDGSYINDNGNLELRNSAPLTSTTLNGLTAGEITNVPNNSFYMDDSNVLYWKDNTGTSKTVNLT